MSDDTIMVFGVELSRYKGSDDELEQWSKSAGGLEFAAFRFIKTGRWSLHVGKSNIGRDRESGSWRVHDRGSLVEAEHAWLDAAHRNAPTLYQDVVNVIDAIEFTFSTGVDPVTQEQP